MHRPLGGPNEGVLNSLMFDIFVDFVVDLEIFARMTWAVDLVVHSGVDGPVLLLQY